MATAPYFHWPPLSTADSDFAGFGSSGSPEIALTATAADTTALVSPDQHQRAVVARPRMRRSSSGSGKQSQQQKAGAGGAKKPPQRGLGVAELERLRCGGDPLRELAGAVDAGVQVHSLMHCNHHHAQAASALDARYCSSLLVPPPPPAPAGPGCYVHHPAAASCHQRAPRALAPDQQYFVDRWGRMGPGFSPPTRNGKCAGGGDHQAQSLAPEHPSSQNTIWRPASSSSSCIQSGHRCDLCSRMVRAFAERGAPLPAAGPPSSPTTAPDYSIYDLAAAMATARQGEAAFVVRDRKRGGALPGEAPAKKEVREIEFFPVARTDHGAGGLDKSEIAAPVSSSYGAGTYAAAPLDLSLRL